jgi:hypothetical protein
LVEKNSPGPLQENVTPLSEDTFAVSVAELPAQIDVARGEMKQAGSVSTINRASHMVVQLFESVTVAEYSPALFGCALLIVIEVFVETKSDGPLQTMR